MIYPKIPLAQSIIEICKAKGVTDIVISPGSRNAPLTIGFANNSAFNCYSIADERCAAFFAMGMAQQHKRPVAVVCTSGSALLNYYPAVAEAFYSQFPIIVISADRPHDKIDIGDGQTIRQENVYANHILYNANLTESASPQNDIQINEAINTAIVSKGPVHINAPFEEPLYETVTELSVYPEIITVQENKSHQDIIIDDIAISVWNKIKKKLILIGVNEPHNIDDAVITQLANDPTVVVMTETTSNLHHDSFLNSIDTIITPFTEEEFKMYQPELLVTFGGMIVSKRVKAWLRQYKPKEHWHIDTLRAYDTYGALTRHFKTTPNIFFSELYKQAENIESNYQNRAQQLKSLREKKHYEYVENAPFSDLKAFAIVLPMLPDYCQLQVSNSSAIRYTQLFTIKPSIEVFCNRGTSGIDGSTSTAIGAAAANNKQTVLLTGDIGFLYDSNALWNVYIPDNFIILLINNGGGGIFRILPGHKETPTFNTYFETSHCFTAEHLAKMYGFEYHTANSELTLTEQLQIVLNSNTKPQLLEIFTPTLDNDAILLQYFKELV